MSSRILIIAKLFFLVIGTLSSNFSLNQDSNYYQLQTYFVSAGVCYPKQ